eukprot:m.139553 g.139553  ORF g.139553 m.139553 type:complete len:327 (+) comp22566_c0_seq1:340-1320(+)
MNIVTPTPTTVLFTTANVNTEAARRDNLQRETIPATSASENSAGETGLGSESDRVKTPGQQNPLTYEKPQSQANSQNTGAQGESVDQDNGEDPSAGKESAQDQQQEQAQQREIEELKARDREVRAHEQAHAAAGGQHAGAPNFEYETGPDGQQYAVGGEVSIDISKEDDPQDTIRKMQQVKAAALAPAEPSPQDLRVASEATQRANEAQSELIKEQSESSKQAVASTFPDNTTTEQGGRTQNSTAPSTNDLTPELDEIVKGIDSGSPIRSLAEDPVAEAVGLESSAEDFRRLREDRDPSIQRRVAVIENFYQAVSQPRDQGVQLRA